MPAFAGMSGGKLPAFAGTSGKSNDLSTVCAERRQRHEAPGRGKFAGASGVSVLIAFRFSWNRSNKARVCTSRFHDEETITQ